MTKNMTKNEEKLIRTVICIQAVALELIDAEDRTEAKNAIKALRILAPDVEVFLNAIEKELEG